MAEWRNDKWWKKFQNGDNPNFNMAEIFLFRLNELLYNCSQARYQRDQLLWFTALDELWNNIAFKVIEEGEEATEEKVTELFNKVEAFFKNASIEDIKGQSISRAENWLRTISREINILLYRYGLLMPIKKIAKAKEELVEDF